jgi:hypothetical protein
MRNWLRLLVFAFTVIPWVVLAQDSPRMTTVTPDNGKIGDVITVSGQHLDTKYVKKVYLTDGKHDVEVTVTQQTPEAIKVKIPDKAKPGRYSLMVLTAEKVPKYIEQPVKCTVEQ